MSTLCYTDYYNAYDNKTLVIDNVDFNIKLVSENYTPNNSHKPSDVTDYIIASVSTIVDNDITTLSMGELIDKMKEVMEVAFISFPDTICEQIDSLFSEEKAEKLKELITNYSENTDTEIWQELKENGIKYFVVEYVDLDILCFCEPIEL